MSIAVIGTGYWGKNLVRNFHALGALRTVCDSEAETLQKISRQYAGTRVVQSYAEVLTDPEIAGVAIATPALLHADMVREAILADKDVYVEKPLCLSEREGAELTALAEERRRILMVGHLLWYHPAVLKLKELIDSGRLGRIQYIYSNRLNLGKLRREENVLWSFAPHDVSVILGLLGEMPESVHARGGNFLHKRIADTTITMLNFPSGVQAHIFVSWLHPFKEQKLVVIGEKEMAVFDDTVPWDMKLTLYPHSIVWSGNVPVVNKADAHPVAIDQTEPLQEECAHFLDCIQTRRQPRTDGKEGLRVLRVLNCSQASLEQERKIDVTPLASSDRGYFVHETAVVENDVAIGGNSKIWHFSHILAGSVLGERCNIGQNVVIGPKVRIGSGCKIQNNVSLYEGVTLEDEVFCGPSMVFTNVMNPRCAISRKHQYYQTLVKKGATLGANCTLVGNITIGRYGFVGAGTVVLRDVPDFGLVVGNPGRQIGWMSRFGERLDLPLAGEAETVCPHTGDHYRLAGGKVACLEGKGAMAG